MNGNIRHHWLDYMSMVTKDPRLNVWHISLIYAIVQLAYRQNEKQIIRVSRSKLMKLSHIATFPTYHKYFHQLQDMGYITYEPSYHPGFRSIIRIVKFKID